MLLTEENHFEVPGEHDGTEGRNLVPILHILVE